MSSTGHPRPVLLLLVLLAQCLLQTCPRTHFGSGLCLHPPAPAEQAPANGGHAAHCRLRAHCCTYHDYTRQCMAPCACSIPRSSRVLHTAPNSVLCLSACDCAPFLGSCSCRTVHLRASPRHACTHVGIHGSAYPFACASPTSLHTCGHSLGACCSVQVRTRHSLTHLPVPSARHATQIMLAASVVMGCDALLSSWQFPYWSADFGAGGPIRCASCSFGHEPPTHSGAVQPPASACACHEQKANHQAGP